MGKGIWSVLGANGLSEKLVVEVIPRRPNYDVPPKNQMRYLNSV